MLFTNRTNGRQNDTRCDTCQTPLRPCYVVASTQTHTVEGRITMSEAPEENTPETAEPTEAQADEPTTEG